MPRFTLPLSGGFSITMSAISRPSSARRFPFSKARRTAYLPSRDPLGERGVHGTRTRSPSGSRLNVVLAFLALFVFVHPVGAQSSLPPSLQSVRFDQRLNEQVPLDLAFKDETGKPVALQHYFSKKPVILVLAYYRCPMLCTEVLN